ncbi:MFS general substrate transporter [Ramaria rubella]|nr:MFS general substrate transporter [Ramaria rubella]
MTEKAEPLSESAMDNKKSSEGSVTGESSEESCVYVSWDGPDDPANPINWSKSHKWIVSWIGFAFMTIVCASISAYAISQPSLERALHVSDVPATLGVVLFTFTFGAAPLIIAPFSELFGRLPVYIASVLVYWIMFLPQALAKNFATVLVVRFIAGIGGSSAGSIVGGILADIWETHERGFPMAIFSFVAFAGTGLGPVAFGYVELKLGYKFVNWILFALSGAFTLALVLASKETRASVLLIKKAARLRVETGDSRYRAKAEEERSSVAKMVKISLTRPVHLLLTEPVLLSFTIWMTFAWGILYLMLESAPIVFTELYGFNVGEAGLVFLGQISGSVLGLGIDIWCDRLYVRHAARKGPEARLYIAMICGVILPTGCWMYTNRSLIEAWTSWSQVPWIVPIIGFCFIYAGLFGIYRCFIIETVGSLACFNYLADSYTVYASSALSAQSFVRLTIGATFSLIAEPMYSRLGIHSAGTLLAALATAFAVTPFILYRYGASVRARSPFAKHLARLEAEKHPDVPKV